MLLLRWKKHFHICERLNGGSVMTGKRVLIEVVIPENFVACKDCNDEDKNENCPLALWNNEECRFICGITADCNCPMQDIKPVD